MKYFNFHQNVNSIPIQSQKTKHFGWTFFSSLQHLRHSVSVLPHGACSRSGSAFGYLGACTERGARMERFEQVLNKILENGAFWTNFWKIKNKLAFFSNYFHQIFKFCWQPQISNFFFKLWRKLLFNESSKYVPMIELSNENILK